jgi:hypothetical protein
VSTRPDFPEVVDSTMRAAFRSCPQKFYQEYILYRRPKGQNIHLHFGGCFAKGIEVTRRAFYEEKLPIDESMAEGAHAIIEMWGDVIPPEKANKTLPRCVEALAAYIAEYPPYSDVIQPYYFGGKPGIEFSFAEEIDVKHPVTGLPVLYGGRYDMNGVYHEDCYCVDEKTTSQLGASWLNQWKLRAQFTGYTWAGQRAGLPVKGAIVRGISILKAKFGHAQVLELRAPWEIDRWYEQLCRDVQSMIRHWEDGYWDYNLDKACADFGGCSYLKLCTVQDPDRWATIDFERRKWDPVEGKETLLGPVGDD